MHGSNGLTMSYGVSNGPTVKYGLLYGINSDTSMIRYNFNCSFRPCQYYSQLHVSDIILLVMKKQVILDIIIGPILFIYSQFYKYII